MVDILITGSLIFTGEEIIKNGYVYISNGRVEAVGEGVVPEEYTYATLLIGGTGRIIVPGLAAIASVASYPLRFKKPSMRDRVNFYRETGIKNLLLAALPAIYELHMSGVTVIIAEGLTVELPLELSKLIGGFYGLAIPACSGIEPMYTPGLASIIKLSSRDCEGEADIIEINERGYKGSKPVLSLFNTISYSIPASTIEDPWVENLELRKALMLPPSTIKPGKLAEIAVYDVSKPPAMLLDMASEQDVMKIYKSGAKLETLIAGEDILVDGGDHLYIVEKHFREARALAEKLLSR
ncbi:MAG: hypothetical protein QXI24_02535 [Acidilobaceae archaeon]